MDFEKIGLMAGIEIHQQLDSGKLFCRCQSILRDEKPDIVFRRRLRASAGESGEVDIAALHEHKKGLEFVYEAYSDTTCLVESDDEPPHEMDSGALGSALLISKMLNALPVDELHVMRKTVVNGSNTSGFQRTVLLARNGFLETNSGKVRIASIMLEEDAAREIKKEKGFVVYRLDRLGIPLVEIGTEPDIKSPEQAKECAEKLGMILRSTGRIKRGIGTIRQDINISVKGGARVEIKGAQDLKLIPRIVEIEAGRQLALLEIKKNLRKKISLDIKDAGDVFKNTESKLIKNAESVYALKLSGFKGVIGKEIGPGKRLGTEFSGCAKTRALVTGIIHSDELPKYGIS